MVHPLFLKEKSNCKSDPSVFKSEGKSVSGRESFYRRLIIKMRKASH